MQCPLCNVDLVMSERQGIEIDYCPKCRGVWLDRGELDKIIERSESLAAPQQPAQPSRDDYDRGREHDRSYDKDYHRGRERDYSYPGKKKHKSSFLGDLFEFGD